MYNCKCCRNFISFLIIPGSPIVLDPGYISSWYRLYPPGGTSAVWIYHNQGSSVYNNYSTTRPINCKDPSTDLVGQAIAYFGCVEDATNSIGSGETDVFAGYSILNLSGRFKSPVKALYSQRSTFGFFKTEGAFTDETDVADAMFGEILYRPVPEGKLVRNKVFGQAFECVFRDRESYLQVIRGGSGSGGITVGSYTQSSGGIGVLESYSINGLSPTGSTFTLLFDSVILGSIQNVTPGFDLRIDQRTIHVIREGTGGLLEFEIVGERAGNITGWV